ncbi:MAG TPA: hypothetical protein VGF95_00305 [Solirubrobacteraceae bacterium]|jgi:hypothetical protein
MVPQPDQPTEEMPLHGTILHRRHPIVLCAIDCWREGDEYVVRASDFDLYAVGATHDEAVAKFIVEVYSLFDALRGLGEKMTDEEQHLFVRLAGPILGAIREERKREDAQLIAFPRFRGDHSPAREWSPSSGHARSNQLSPA